jgi:hypothetical protein
VRRATGLVGWFRPWAMPPSQSLGPKWGMSTVHLIIFFRNPFFIKISRKLYKFLKFMENRIKLLKIWNKFLYNPLD